MVTSARPLLSSVVLLLLGCSATPARVVESRGGKPLEAKHVRTEDGRQARQEGAQVGRCETGRSGSEEGPTGATATRTRATTGRRTESTDSLCLLRLEPTTHKRFDIADPSTQARVINEIWNTGARLEQVLVPYRFLLARGDPGRLGNIVGVKYVEVDKRGALATPTEVAASRELDASKSAESPGKAADLPNDPLAYEQWSLTAVGVDRFWGGPDNWPTRARTAALVAVLDSGVLRDHDDFDKESIEFSQLSRNFDDPTHEIDRDDLAHGTRVASILCAEGNNERGIAGFIWSGVVVDFKVLADRETRPVYPLVGAMFAAVEAGASVINLSVTVSLDHESRSLTEAVDYAFENGVFIVCAAGNGARNLDRTSDKVRIYPGDLHRDNVIVVAAVDRSMVGLWTSSVGGAGSNYGKETVTLAAPGVDIVCADSRNQSAYGKYSGTSYAVPQVVGALALKWSSLQAGRIKAKASGEPRKAALVEVRNSFLENNTRPVKELAEFVNGGRVLFLKAP